jgi:hypothetical protein
MVFARVRACAYSERSRSSKSSMISRRLEGCVATIGAVFGEINDLAPRFGRFGSKLVRARGSKWWLAPPQPSSAEAVLVLDDAHSFGRPKEPVA